MLNGNHIDNMNLYTITFKPHPSTNTNILSQREWGGGGILTPHLPPPT